MPELFPITDRQIARDQTHKQAMVLAISICLAMGWMAWMLFARINVYATTDQARLEVAQYLVQAPVSGRVIESHLELGRVVEPGTVLVELEADPQKLRVQEEETRRQGLDAQLEDLRRQLIAQRRALVAERAAGQSATRQALASVAEARQTARLAQEEFTRRASLHKQGIISELELLRFESESKKKDIGLQSLQTAVSRAKREQLMHERERQAAIAGLEGDIGRIQGEFARSGHTVKRLEGELNWHRIVASGRGRLGEIVNLKSGAYVREGDRLAAIIPDGQLRIVAYFEPRTVIGRVKAGQTGRLRLDGFPWSEYGSISASVTSVGDEVRDGRVRVELDPRANPRVPLQHGLPGTLEIQVERISPASFLLRKGGGYLARPANSQVASR